MRQPIWIDVRNAELFYLGYSVSKYNPGGKTTFKIQSLTEDGKVRDYHAGHEVFRAHTKAEIDAWLEGAERVSSDLITRMKNQ